MKQWWGDIDRGKPNYSKQTNKQTNKQKNKQTCPRATSSIKNPTWTVLGSAMGLISKVPTRNILSHGMAPYGFTDLININKKVKVTL